jgi:hypothetical protein
MGWNMTKDELLQQLTVNNGKVADIQAEIAKQRQRPQTAEVRLVVREFSQQLEYWKRDKARITEALERLG